MPVLTISASVSVLTIAEGVNFFTASLFGVLLIIRNTLNVIECIRKILHSIILDSTECTPSVKVPVFSVNPLSKLCGYYITL